VASVTTRRKLYITDFAALAGLSEHTIGSYHRRGAARFPRPDGIDIEYGHARPWWWESTALKWQANRPGKGWKRRK